MTGLNNLIDNTRKNSQKKIKREIKGLVIKSISKGISPVEKGGTDATSGKARYEPYSDSYKKQIKNMSGKSERPVNLKVSGRLHRSLKARLTRKGVSLWFADKKAKYHDIEGAGKAKVIRRMLPRDGEQFSRTIRERIIDIVDNALKKAAKR